MRQVLSGHADGACKTSQVHLTDCFVFLAGYFGKIEVRFDLKVRDCGYGRLADLCISVCHEAGDGGDEGSFASHELLKTDALASQFAPEHLRLCILRIGAHKLIDIRNLLLGQSHQLDAVQPKVSISFLLHVVGLELQRYS